MTRSPSTILFALILAFALALLGWWTFFQARDCGRVERAAACLRAGDADGAARALGAPDADALAELARRRRAMFLSEGAVFGVILVLGGFLFVAALRSEGRVRADQDRFLAGATHELRTPLTTIRLLLESLRDGRVPEDKADRWLGSGLIELERLERGLTNLLTLAGLRTAGRALRAEPGDLAADVRRAVEASTPRAEAAGVVLRTGTLAPVAAPRDAEALQIVLRNLLDNAVKYSPAGTSVELQLAVEGGDALITVADQGRGMDAHELAQAFRPFFRGAGQAGGGTGLGLHLARELVRSHGGELRAHSDGPGQGCRFTVALPRAGAGR